MTDTKHDDQDQKQNASGDKRKPSRLHLPDELRFQVKTPPPASPKDFAVQLIVHTRSKLDVATLPKLTDSQGEVVFTRDELIQTAKTLKSMFPKDYNRMDTDATGTITAIVLGERDLVWAKTAFDLHQDQGSFPDSYGETLDRGINKAHNISDLIPEIEIITEHSEQLKIVTRVDIGHTPPPTYEEKHYEFATEGKRVA